MLERFKLIISISFILILTIIDVNGKACTICSCTNDNLDCSSKQLEHHLNDTDLEGTTFNDVIFDNNAIIHLKPFPVMAARKLSFRRNGIAYIDNASFRDVKNLTELDLSHNHLTSQALRPHCFMGNYSPQSYEPLKSLTILRLSGNSLHTLHADLFEHLPNLRELSLDSNPFEMIDKPTIIAIASIYKLEILDLSSTKIFALPTTMLHTPRYLSTFNLSNNLFTSVPISLGEAGESLKILNLDNNPINYINSFPSLRSLEVLHINYMPQLHHIGSGAFKNLPNLKQLYISNNLKLENIAEDTFSGKSKEEPSWPPLEKLYINNNRLSYLAQSFLARWDHLNELDISMNPWSCDCLNQWFLITLIPQYQKVNKDKAYNLMCEEPIEMHGRHFVNLSNSRIEMRCLDTRNGHPEKDAMVLVAILIGLLVAIPLVLAMFAIYRRTFSNSSPLVQMTYKRADF